MTKSENNTGEYALCGRLPLKISAFILIICTVSLCIAGAVGAVAMLVNGFYFSSLSRTTDTVFESMAYDKAAVLYSMYSIGDTDGIKYNLQDTNIAVGIGETVIGDIDIKNAAVYDCGTRYYTKETDGEVSESSDNVKIYIDKSFPYTDSFSIAAGFIEKAYNLRYAVIVFTLLSLVVSVFLFAFLMCAAGRRHGRSEVYVSLSAKLPADLYTAIYGFATVMLLIFTFDYSLYNSEEEAVFAVLALVAAEILVMVYCMNIAVRVKSGTLFRNSIIYRVLSWLYKTFLKLVSLAGAFFRSLPLVWKTTVSVALVCFTELFAFSFIYYKPDFCMTVMLILNAAVILFALYSAAAMKKLQRAGRALADGDMAYHIDTRYMYGDFRDAANDLNSISAGMSKAVDERLKSERFKTELITNVSHDIKTPLTSIINYAGLISREQTDNEKITEYAAVLTRQSERMKKLIEDLVEASKASTGAITVNFAPCEIGVLLTQAAGEYEQRFEARGLTLVTKQPETPLTISADGRLLWRVLDNLMNNICKYAQSGTRVYIDLELIGQRAVMTFKNISRDPLNVPANELMERFVRGDSSRNSDGYGLGLSIASSLSEIQGGTLDLSVDGDLFKATLSFPVIEALPSEQPPQLLLQ